MERQPLSKIKKSSLSSRDSLPSRVTGTPVHPVHTLQRSIGNQAMYRMIESKQSQAKLRDVQSNDLYELKADREVNRNRFTKDPGAVSLPSGNVNQHCSSCKDGAEYCLKCANEQKIHREESVGPISKTNEPVYSQAPASSEGVLIQHTADSVTLRRSQPSVQHRQIDNLLKWFADKVNLIPGFRLLTIVIGINPVNLAQVESSSSNILRALLELIPIQGVLLANALERYGIFSKVGIWVEMNVRTLGLIGIALKNAFSKFVNSLSWRDLFRLDDIFKQGKQIFTEPIERLLIFSKSLVSDILGFIRKAILLPLAKLAEGTRGYELLKSILGQDPMTGTVFPRTPETLIGGFLKLIGQEEVWENIKKANAVARVWAWFQNVLSGLIDFVGQIPLLVAEMVSTLVITDLILPLKAFAKIVSVIGGFVVRIVKWGGQIIWTLLELIFEVVSPGALVYLKKTGVAFLSILKNPIPFVYNLVNAARLGFSNFAENIVIHIKTGIIDWLTGSLDGVYIPKDLSLAELGKFTISILGITWVKIREKIVKKLGPKGEIIMKGLETTFDVIVKLVTEGPSAVWDMIKDKLGELKDKVIGGIINFVTDTIVKRAVPKLISLFVPGAGFITAIMSIYDTIMVFVEKISKIVQVVTAFLDSIVMIAAGNISSAAQKVEKVLSNMLSLTISFMAGFVGLGSVTGKIKVIIEKIRGSVDKAVEVAITWIINKAKKLFAQSKEAVGKSLSWAFATTSFKDFEGQTHSVKISDNGLLTIESNPQLAENFVTKYAETMKKKGKKVNPKILEELREKIYEVNNITKKINSSKKKSDKIPAPEQQKATLKLNSEISQLLSRLINNDKKIGKNRDKYLLEGLVGTYATVPKPVKDSMTPDHQPQASLIMATADFFSELGIEGSELQERAASRAQKGWAINLHHNRHIKGRTYGTSSEKTKDRTTFKQNLKRAAGISRDKQKFKDVARKELQREVIKDANWMKKVVKKKIEDEKSPWSDLKKEFIGKDDKKLTQAEKNEAEKLRKQIQDQVIAGEDLIINQPFDF